MHLIVLIFFIEIVSVLRNRREVEGILKKESCKCCRNLIETASYSYVQSKNGHQYFRYLIERA